MSMFLSELEKLGFLATSKDSGVFLPFPEETRRVIANQVVGVFLRKEVSPDTLVTPNHLLVMMECAGQAFDLPITMESIETIASATELYRRWLLDVDKARPLPIQENPHTFLKLILNHFSMLFNARTTASAEMREEHVKLTVAVLDILRNAGHQSASIGLDEETFEHLLLVVLGVSNMLLSPKSSIELFEKKLCPVVLKVLFELWLLSGTKNEKMWAHLKSLVKNWRHRLPTIQQWSATILALGECVLRILYGPLVGTEKVLLPFKGSVTEVTLDKEYALYAWYRFMHLLGDLETISNPRNYVEAMRGIGNMMAQLMNVSKVVLQEEDGVIPPDGNNILHLLGPFLFEAVNTLRPGFEHGKAEALESLCSLFTTFPETHYDPEYLGYFYRGLELGMQLENPLLLSVVLKNSVELLHFDLPGVHVLVPSFMNAVEGVLTSTRLDGIIGSVQDIRRSAVACLGNVLCMATYYGTAPFLRPRDPIDRVDAKFGELPRPRLAHFSDLQPHVDFVLLEALSKEADGPNLKRLLWAGEVHLFDTIRGNKTFAIKFIRILLTQICTKGSFAWPDEVILVCFHILSDLASLVQFLQDGEVAGAAKYPPAWIVSTLCKYMDISCSTQCTTEPPRDATMVAALKCVQAWTMSGNWALVDRAKLAQVLSVLAIFSGHHHDGGGEGSNKKHWPASARMKEAARTFLNALIYHNGQFPGAHTGAALLTALPRESDVLAHAKLTSKSISCFVHNKTVMSVVRHPRATAQDPFRLTLVMRDSAGRYVWECTMRYFGEGPMDGTVRGVGGAASRAHRIHEPTDPPPHATRLLEALEGEAAVHAHDVVARAAHARHAAERAHLEATAYGRNDQRATVAPTPVVSAKELDTTPSRVFLSHMGFLSLVNHSQFHLLHTNPAKPFNFVSGFKRVDEQRERECFSIGLVYVAEGQLSAEDVYANTGGSAAYTEFVGTLGTLVDLATHPGYRGGLASPEHGRIAPYYADLTHEVVFHVATLMPNIMVGGGGASASIIAGASGGGGGGDGAPAHQRKKAVMHSNKVTIYWVENLREFQTHPTYLGMDKKAAHIIIHPLRTGMYKVVIIKDAALAVGPLQDGMLVHKAILSCLVRQTAINMARNISIADSGTPSTIRSLLLDDFTKHNSVDVGLATFYGSQFSMGN